MIQIILPRQALFSLWAHSLVLECLVEGGHPVATHLNSLTLRNQTIVAAVAAGQLTGSKQTDRLHLRRTST